MNIETFHSTILRISSETGIPTKKCLDVLHILSAGEPIENNELVRMLGLSKNALTLAKKMLTDMLEPTSNSTKLRTGVYEQIAPLFSSEYEREEAMWGFLENEKYRMILELLIKHQDKRPSPERKYDQFTATVETTARRVSLIDLNEDVYRKRLLFLGDDDFTSVAAASLRKTSGITVLDIDNRILDNITGTAKEENLEIVLDHYDARNALPEQYRQKFDVVFTDPPYTLEGIRLFVSRAIQALNSQNRSARIYLCYGNSDRATERFLPIYELLNSSGLMTRWVFDKFNRYHGAESIGSTSSLFILDITSKTKTLVTGDYDRAIYTNN